MATDPTRTDQENLSAVPSDAPADKTKLVSKAQWCRRLAAGVSDEQAAKVLNGLARNYEAAADRMPEQD